MRETARATAHDFTLDELQAYDEGTLAPERAVIVAAHLAAGCPACRAWIATSHEVGRLRHAAARLDDPDAFLLQTPPARARRWLRRRMRPRRFAVLLVVLPLKARLVRRLFRTQQTWETRLSATISLAALTVAVFRFVFARPAWSAGPVGPAPTPAARRPTEDGDGNGDGDGGRGRR